MSKRAAGLLEIVGIFIVVAGGCGLVAAAAMVAVALAVLVASVLLILAGVVGVYLAVTLETPDDVKATARAGVQ
jgi:hypothetical protein